MDVSTWGPPAQPQRDPTHAAGRDPPPSSDGSGPSRRKLASSSAGGIAILVMSFIAFSILGNEAPPPVAAGDVSPTPTASPSAEPTIAATPEATPEPTPVPTPAGPPAELAVGDWATVTVDELHVRAAAGAQQASSYELIRGAVLTVAEGPAGRGRRELVPRRIPRRRRRVGVERLDRGSLSRDDPQRPGPDPLRRGRQPGLRHGRRRPAAARGAAGRQLRGAGQQAGRDNPRHHRARPRHRCRSVRHRTGRVRRIAVPALRAQARRAATRCPMAKPSGCGPPPTRTCTFVQIKDPALVHPILLSGPAANRIRATCERC